MIAGLQPTIYELGGLGRKLEARNPKQKRKFKHEKFRTRTRRATSCN